MGDSVSARSMNQLRHNPMIPAYDHLKSRPVKQRVHISWNLPLVSILFTVALGASACSHAPRSTVSEPRVTSHRILLTLSDNHRTVDVLWPAMIRVSLPYLKSTGSVWQLASGGAGFSEIGSSTFHSSTSSKTNGMQVFHFDVTSKAVLPLVLDYGPPGPLPNNPVKRFQVTIRPQFNGEQ